MSRPQNDPRFNFGLVSEVIVVLRKHGFVESDNNSSRASTLEALLKLVECFEGKSE